MSHSANCAPPDLPERLLTALGKIGQILRSQTCPNLQKLRLSSTQAQILTVLAAGQSESKRLADVAAALGVSLATASDAVAALLCKKLVARSPVPGDRRAMSLRLTASGARVSRRVSEWPQKMVAAISRLEVGEQVRTLDGLVRILRVFEAARLIPVARMCPTCQNFRPNAHPEAARPHHCALLDIAVGDAEVRFDCVAHVRSSPCTCSASSARRPAKVADVPLGAFAARPRRPPTSKIY